MGADGFTVIISRLALRDLEEVVRYIARDNPAAAERIGGQLIAEAEATASHPFAGRKVPEFDDPLLRERLFRSWRIVYRVDEARRLIVVSRFWHSARNTPEIPLRDELES